VQNNKERLSRAKVKAGMKPQYERPLRVMMNILAFKAFNSLAQNVRESQLERAN